MAILGDHAQFKFSYSQWFVTDMLRGILKLSAVQMEKFSYQETLSFFAFSVLKRSLQGRTDELRTPGDNFILLGLTTDQAQPKKEIESDRFTVGFVKPLLDPLLQIYRVALWLKNAKRIVVLEVSSFRGNHSLNTSFLGILLPSCIVCYFSTYCVENRMLAQSDSEAIFDFKEQGLCS